MRRNTRHLPGFDREKVRVGPLALTWPSLDRPVTTSGSTSSPGGPDLAAARGTCPPRQSPPAAPGDLLAPAATAGWRLQRRPPFPATGWRLRVLRGSRPPGLCDSFISRCRFLSETARRFIRDCFRLLPGCGEADDAAGICPPSHPALAVANVSADLRDY